MCYPMHISHFRPTSLKRNNQQKFWLEGPLVLQQRDSHGQGMLGEVYWRRSHLRVKSLRCMRSTLVYFDVLRTSTCTKFWGQNFLRREECKNQFLQGKNSQCYLGSIWNFKKIWGINCKCCGPKWNKKLKFGVKI